MVSLNLGRSPRNRNLPYQLTERSVADLSSALEGAYNLARIGEGIAKRKTKIRARKAQDRHFCNLVTNRGDQMLYDNNDSSVNIRMEVTRLDSDEASGRL